MNMSDIDNKKIQYWVPANTLDFDEIKSGMEIHVQHSGGRSRDFDYYRRDTDFDVYWDHGTSGLIPSCSVYYLMADNTYADLDFDLDKPLSEQSIYLVASGGSSGKHGTFYFYSKAPIIEVEKKEDKLLINDEPLIDYLIDEFDPDTGEVLSFSKPSDWSELNNINDVVVYYACADLFDFPADEDATAKIKFPLVDILSDLFNYGELFDDLLYTFDDSTEEYSDVFDEMLRYDELDFDKYSQDIISILLPRIIKHKLPAFLNFTPKDLVTLLSKKHTDFEDEEWEEASLAVQQVFSTFIGKTLVGRNLVSRISKSEFLKQYVLQGITDIFEENYSDVPAELKEELVALSPPLIGEDKNNKYKWEWS
jgi:hypothetical protein